MSKNPLKNPPISISAWPDQHGRLLLIHDPGRPPNALLFEGLRVLAVCVPRDEYRSVIHYDPRALPASMRGKEFQEAIIAFARHAIRRNRRRMWDAREYERRRKREARLYDMKWEAAMRRVCDRFVKQVIEDAVKDLERRLWHGDAHEQGL